jgi:hypothetical protein
MNMRKILLPLLLLALPLAAQEAKAPSAIDAAAALVTADGLKAHLMVIAGDEFAGRNSGYPGNDKMAEYAAAHFKKIGLAPAGEKDESGAATWFQSFEVRKKKTRNVLGMAEGTDPDLKSEIVVIGAHLDHVGQDGENNAGRMKSKGGDKEDKIWNGADDNGSGTVTVLEIARAFMQGKVRTKRSVLFMLFSGEEYGLLGSKHYVENPLHPLSKTVAMINLDMVGRNPDKALDVGGVSTSDAWIPLCEEAAKGTDPNYKTSGPVMPGSDHASFSQVKVPAIHFFTGFHADYHCQSDHPDKIAYDRMAKIGAFGLRLLALTADRTPRMEFSGPKTLGVETETLDDDELADLKLADDEGALKMVKVNPDSAAGRSGMKEGDILLEFNGKKLGRDNPLGTLRAELRKVKNGVDVPIVVLRDGKKATLTAVWGKKSF